MPVIDALMIFVRLCDDDRAARNRINAVFHKKRYVAGDIHINFADIMHMGKDRAGIFIFLFNDPAPLNRKGIDRWKGYIRIQAGFLLTCFERCDQIIIFYADIAI